MKYYGAFVLVSLLIGYSQAAVTKEEMDETFRVLSQKCKQDTGASDADVEAIVKHEIASTPEGKCLRSCLMTKFELINADGKLIKEKMLKVADIMVKGDAAKLKVAEEILDSCKDVTDADPCEAAYKIIKCLKEAADSRGIRIEW